jgi:hypothetical protein
MNVEDRPALNFIGEFTTIGLVECDITDAGNSLVARASRTCIMLRGNCQVLSYSM